MTTPPFELWKATDGQLLWVGLCLEEDCALRFHEMAEALEFVDSPHARTFRTMATDEEKHRERLASAWRTEGEPRLSAPEVRRWMSRHYPAIAEPYDREDGDGPRALERANAIERESAAFYEIAVMLAAKPDVRALMRELSRAEAEHARAALGSAR